jgi:flavin-dependent dehydrogenase
MAMRFSTAILGGGPAGTAAAIALARNGLRVALLERSHYVAPRVGETLAPSVKPLLYRLDVCEVFQNDRHLPSPGIVSVWAGEQPYENDFIFNPYGNGWHLDRARFDRSLAESAEKYGATIFRSARVRSCIRRGDQNWVVKFEADKRMLEIDAVFLIDATGRSAWLARKQGARRIALDRLVATIGVAQCSNDGDQRTIIEAAPDGWWYSARLPRRKAVAMYMTDADWLPRSRNLLHWFWRERLQQAPLIAEVLPEIADLPELRTVSANSARLNQFTGPGWLAVGDAALTYDPLSSQGICTALESGLRAAQAITQLWNGQGSALEEYTAWLEDEFEAYLRQYAFYYAQVKRWPDSQFWQRRQRSWAERKSAVYVTDTQRTTP